MSSFKELGIRQDYLKGLKELGIVSPTEIQEQALPFLMQKGTDFIGQAPTGTGKTAAFGLPILHNIDPKLPKVQALILAPTRELGMQIAKQLFRFTKYTDKIFAEAVYGGEKIEFQMARLKRPTHVVVATPGRLVDLLSRKAVDLRHIKTLVLDEADEMLSMGFKKELDQILARTSGTRHTWLFSATMPKEIKQIIATYMAPDAFRVTIDRQGSVNAGIDHRYVVSEESQKLHELVHFLKQQGDQRGIVFCKTKVAAQTLTKQLLAKNLSADVIHGDLKQIERDKAMRAFKKENVRLLVATDISARGIDVADLAFVAHYQLPDQMEYYTHRSGRTARAGKRGTSVCFVVSQEVKDIKRIERELGITFTGG